MTEPLTQRYRISAVLDTRVAKRNSYSSNGIRIAKDKTEVTYDKVYSALKQHNLLLNPASIMDDYERAALNALTQNFPIAEIQGCFLHFGQAIWRQIQALGSQQRYLNHE